MSNANPRRAMARRDSAPHPALPAGEGRRRRGRRQRGASGAARLRGARGCGSSISTTRSIPPTATCSPRSTRAWASSSPAISAYPSSTRATCRRSTTASSAPRCRGLMQVHRMDPKPFLDYVHDIDLSRDARASRAGRRHRQAARPQADLHQRLARACRAGGRQARRAAVLRGHLRHRRRRLRAQADGQPATTTSAACTASTPRSRPCSRTCRTTWRRRTRWA